MYKDIYCIFVCINNKKQLKFPSDGSIKHTTFTEINTELLNENKFMFWNGYLAKIYMYFK